MGYITLHKPVTPTMIIIKVDGDADIQSYITAISSIIFNMECGEYKFDPDGNIVEDGGDYHNICDGGITYNIVGNTGNIVILGIKTTDLAVYTESLKWELGRKLKILDAKCATKEPLKIHERNATDYNMSIHTSNTRDRSFDKAIKKKDS